MTTFPDRMGSDGISGGVGDRNPTPHMCRDEHIEIKHGLSDDIEFCPLCHVLSALTDLILLCRRTGLDATAEYNGAWSALSRAAGRDEIEMRREARDNWRWLQGNAP